MAASNDQEDVMADEFDRKWLALIAPLTWVEAFYALIGLTRLGEHPTTVERLAAALQRPEDEALANAIAEFGLLLRDPEPVPPGALS
jgi:hypothetical protein